MRKPIKARNVFALILAVIGGGAFVVDCLYLFCLLMCGVWNHIVVRAFPQLPTMTLFQAFAVYAVLSIIGGFFFFGNHWRKGQE